MILVPTSDCFDYILWRKWIVMKVGDEWMIIKICSMLLSQCTLCENIWWSWYVFVLSSAFVSLSVFRNFDNRLQTLFFKQESAVTLVWKTISEVDGTNVWFASTMTCALRATSLAPPPINTRRSTPCNAFFLEVTLVRPSFSQFYVLQLTPAFPCLRFRHRKSLF